MFSCTGSRWSLLATIAALLSASSAVAATLTFDTNDSIVTYTHELDSVPTDTDSMGPITPVASPSGLVYTSPGLSNGPGTLFSTARAGLGYTSTPFSANAVIASGTNVTQTDTSGSSDFSKLEISFENYWAVSGSTFSPIIANFSMPIYAVVPPGGEVKIDVDVEWGERDGGNYTQKWEMNSSFPSMKSYTSTTIENLFIPATLISGPNNVGVNKDFVVKGVITLEAENTTGPVGLAFDPFTRSSVNYQFETDGTVGQAPTIAIDSAPNGGEQTGIYGSGGGGGIQLVPGLGGQGAAASFGASGERIMTENVEIQDGFTVDFWLNNRNSFFQTNEPLVQATNTSGEGFSINTIQGTQNVEASIQVGPALQTLDPQVPVLPGNYHYFALTFEPGPNGNTFLYQDGELVSALALPLDDFNESAFSLSLGGMMLDIDEFNLYAKPLDPFEIAERYQLGLNNPELLHVLPTLPLQSAGGAPEPGTFALLGFAVAGLVVRRRRGA